MISTGNPKEAVARMIQLPLFFTILLLASCENEGKMLSSFCAEIHRGESDEHLRQTQLVAFDSFFEELRFEHDGHLDDRCVKSFWGRDSSATLNVCTDLTIVMSFGEGNVKNNKLDELLEVEVRWLFGLIS